MRSEHVKLGNVIRNAYTRRAIQKLIYDVQRIAKSTHGAAELAKHSCQAGVESDESTNRRNVTFRGRIRGGPAGSATGLSAKRPNRPHRKLRPAHSFSRHGNQLDQHCTGKRGSMLRCDAKGTGRSFRWRARGFNFAKHKTRNSAKSSKQQFTNVCDQPEQTARRPNESSQ